jgi:hypothetical protein
VFRFALAEEARAPLASGRVLHSFASVEMTARRFRADLGIEQALFLLDDWLGAPSQTEPSRLAASLACGGDAGLESCARAVHESGFLLGLGVDRAQLVNDAGAARPAGEAAWRRALDLARAGGGFGALVERARPDLVLVREPGGEGSDPALVEARRDLAALAVHSFGLWGTNLATWEDAPFAAVAADFEHGLEGLPRHGAAFPLVPALLGPRTRLLPPAGAGLAADDAARVLTNLVFGIPPVFDIGSDAGGEDAGDPGAAAGCFAQEDGWARGRGLSRRERFIKNVYELASVLGEIQAREPLAQHAIVTADGSVRRSTFGFDLHVLVNYGPHDHEDEETGTVLPPMGFLVRHPFFYAFHARRAGGLAYDAPAFFTLRSLEGKMYLRAERCRIYHGFGPNQIRVGGRDFTVDGESIVRIW